LPDVATELLRAPIRSGDHQITIFSRSEPPTTQNAGVSYKQVNYLDLPSLTTAFQGFDTCLCFLISHLDINNATQKNIIQACISAGVRRFAPSEWCLASNSGIPTYSNKDIIVTYLHDLRATNKLGNLEYCLFQPSVFMDYFAHPYPLSPTFTTFPFFIDFENRRAMILDEGTYPIVLTAVSDVSEYLALALNDPRPWPVVGDMQGCRTNSNQLLALGKKIRGGKWVVEYVKSEDVERGDLKTSWLPRFDHPAVPVDMREAFSKAFVLAFLRAMKTGAWDVGREWNQKFPQHKPVGLEEYLSKAWKGKA
jgi:hypothetical protein